MCDAAVDDLLETLKLNPNWLQISENTTKMIKKLFTTLYADENILYFYEMSGDAIFNRVERGILNIDLNNICLDNNFCENDPDVIILIDFSLGMLNLKNAKNLKKKKSEELMSVAWHPNK